VEQRPTIEYETLPKNQRVNASAVASVVFGALALIACAAIPVQYLAVVLGVAFGLMASTLGLLALGDTRARRIPTNLKVVPRQAGFGMAGVGVLLAAVGIALNVLAGYVFAPPTSRASESANRVKCASNLRHLGRALHAYAAAGVNDHFPPDLETLYRLSDLDSHRLLCPSGDELPAHLKQDLPESNRQVTFEFGETLSYLYLGAPMSAEVPSNVVLAYELPHHHRNDGGNVLFGYGRVEFLAPPELIEALAQSQLLLSEWRSSASPTTQELDR
jgi:hypothetical protein